MKIVIGLSGVKTSGKSTAANIIAKLLKENVTELALADKLKNISAEVFNVPRWAFDNQLVKEKQLIHPRVLDEDKIEKILSMFGVIPTKNIMKKYSNIVGMKLNSPRHIAQIVGTEILRSTGDEDIHCKNIKIEEGITIISDIRFSNEFNYFNSLKNIYFVPFYIQRDDAEKHTTLNSHSSEISVFDFCDKCIKISNNKELQDFKTQIKLNLICAGFKLKNHNL